MGLEANATAVVYALDRSGSMIETFDAVKREAKASAHALDANQQFHFVLFSKAAPIEPPARALVPATAENMKKADEFLRQQYPSGATDPLLAMSRAFEMLAKEAGKEKVIFFMTDSDFPDNDAVIKLCSRLNAKKDVRIFTVIIGSASSPPENAEEAMEAIASQNGGRYKYVNVHD